MTLERLRSEVTFKILLIGDSSVGKTSLMFRFADDKFSENFTPTIGIDFKMKTIRVKNKIVKLQLWDTAGQEKFFNITRNYYRNADAIILVYDRTEASTFQHVSRWMSCIDNDAPENVLRVLVGNKSDLYHRIVISTQDGKKLADQYHVNFFETSAKSDTNQNVSKLFYFLTEKLLELRQPISKQPTDSINLSNNQTDSMYGKLAGCCSLTTPTTSAEK